MKFKLKFFILGFLEFRVHCFNFLFIFELIDFSK